MEVLTAVSGKDALEIAERKRIDSMILDNRLPDISGIEVLQKIKQLHPHIEVLMVTGHASIETAVEAMKAGARDYIEKPVRLALLHEKMLTIIELLKRRQEAEDYNLAKDSMEADAHRDISSLNNAITQMKQCREKVIGIIDSDRSDDDKVELIRQEISRFNSNND
jgi:DNA-binding NtrC family response regulator